MKHLFFCFLLILTISLFAQTKVKKDENDNYVPVKTEKSAKVKAIETKTGKTYTDSKGNVYPVYYTSSGKKVIYIISGKTGMEYKQNMFSKE